MSEEGPQIGALGPTVARPALRADARHNRDRLLEAASLAFAEGGLGVPVRAIARRAGVGVATLYRRFPTREMLIHAVFEEHLAVCMGAIEDALDNPDPWDGFCAFIRTICDLQARDRGFTQAFYNSYPGGPAIQQRARVMQRFAVVTQRAQECGKLRKDFEPSDLSLILLANSGVRSPSHDVTLAASRRLVAYLMQSLGAERPLPLPPPASPLLAPVLETTRGSRETVLSEELEGPEFRPDCCG